MHRPRPERRRTRGTERSLREIPHLGRGRQQSCGDATRRQRWQWRRHVAALVLGGVAAPLGGKRLSVASQCATLSLGQEVARRRAWSRRSTLALASLLSVAFGGVTVMSHAWPPSSWTRVSLTPSAASRVVFGFLGAGMGVSVFWFLVFQLPRQLHAAETRALAAENELRQAELARLRSYLHPYFLLNTLNAVAGLSDWLLTAPESTA